MTEPDLRQEWLADFDTIRSFNDSEVAEKIGQLLNESQFREHFSILFSAFSEKDRGALCVTELLESFRQAATVDQLQSLEKRFLDTALKSTLKNVTTLGLEAINASNCATDPQKNTFLFISNHRDIVLDPLLLNWITLEKGLPACHCAIGDNLLVDSSGKLIALLNKCFVVLRSVKSPKAMVMAMRNQAAYIRHLRFNDKTNLWIAQREGRSKDSSDQTNPALIKMLGLAKPKEISLGSYIKSLGIVPVSLSYEWDPCDIQKAEELLAMEQGTYKKQGLADLKAVRDGLIGNKGRIQVFFDTQFSQRIADDANHNDIARMIDQSIQKNYAFYPVNFAAVSMLTELTSLDGGIKKVINEMADKASCTSSERMAAKQTLEQRLDGASLELRIKVLTNYAQPIITYARHQISTH